MTLDLEERNSVQDEGENPPTNSDTCESEPLEWEKMTGWLGTIISKAVRALAARLVQRQRIL